MQPITNLNPEKNPFCEEEAMPIKTPKRFAITRENPEAPARLYVQIYPRTNLNHVIACEIDPREVHDNGKPVYEYVLDSANEAKNAALVEMAKDAAIQALAYIESPAKDDYQLSLVKSKAVEKLRALRALADKETEIIEL